nr:hypothetical protein [Tanacetum cinerariifolium]
MGDEHLNTITAMESDEFIKSSVENLVPNPSESKGENGCDSLYDEDVPEKIFSNPLFEEEIIPLKIDQYHDNAESDLVESIRTYDSLLIISSKIDSLLYEFVGELILLKSIPPRIDETDCDPEEDICLIERLLLTITLVPNQEKSPDLLPHQGLKTFQPSAECPMMIHGKNTPILDVPLFHFYPLDQFRYEGNWVKLSDLKQALRGRHFIIPGNVKILAKGFCTQVFISSV